MMKTALLALLATLGLVAWASSGPPVVTQIVSPANGTNIGCSITVRGYSAAPPMISAEYGGSTVYGPANASWNSTTGEFIHSFVLCDPQEDGFSQWETIKINLHWGPTWIVDTNTHWLRCDCPPCENTTATFAHTGEPPQ